MIKLFPDLIQGSEEWLSARVGLLTASEMKLIITPDTKKPANNEKSRAHMYELLAQRVNQYVEPHYVGDDMLRGMKDEIEARLLYEKHYAPVADIGFITNDKWGFTLGYSPDGLVGEDGAIECKSRRQRFQIETIINYDVPAEYMVQIQTGLLVSERSWIDFISYCGGMHMMTKRIYPHKDLQDAIINAATIFENKMKESLDQYKDNLENFSMQFIPTERKIANEGEITI